MKAAPSPGAKRRQQQPAQEPPPPPSAPHAKSNVEKESGAGLWLWLWDPLGQVLWVVLVPVLRLVWVERVEVSLLAGSITLWRVSHVPDWLLRRVAGTLAFSDASIACLRIEVQPLLLVLLSLLLLLVRPLRSGGSSTTMPLVRVRVEGLQLAACSDVYQARMLGSKRARGRASSTQRQKQRRGGGGHRWAPSATGEGQPTSNASQAGRQPSAGGAGGWL